MICLVKREVNNIATVNFISYRTQCTATLKGVVRYVCQQLKTGIDRENLALKHWDKGLLPQKDNTIKLLSGINCTPESACSEFISTKEIYNKNSGVQFYHYTQSFKCGENISPQVAHEIALKFAEENYKDFEVLVATHMDKEHLHSHFIINAVSFETGKKLHQPPSTIRALRLSSDNICKAYGLTVLETYTFGRSKTPSRAEKRAYQKGTSWKEKLRKTIDVAMTKSRTKQEFIDFMVAEGYETKWTETRKTITYTCPNGKACRDDKLFGDKYSKINMELEFEYRSDEIKETETPTGWEKERELLNNPVAEELLNQDVPVNDWANELLWHAKHLEHGINEDDELQTITEIASLTMLSFVGVYLLLEKLLEQPEEEITDDFTKDLINELLEEPENNIDFEDEQEQQGFTMTM